MHLIKKKMQVCNQKRLSHRPKKMQVNDFETKGPKESKIAKKKNSFT